MRYRSKYKGNSWRILTLRAFIFLTKTLVKHIFLLSKDIYLVKIQIPLSLVLFLYCVGNDVHWTIDWCKIFWFKCEQGFWNILCPLLSILRDKSGIVKEHASVYCLFLTLFESRFIMSVAFNFCLYGNCLRLGLFFFLFFFWELKNLENLFYAKMLIICS